MSISIQHDIIPILDEELPKLLKRFDAERETINALLSEFKRNYGERVIEDLGEGTFCETVQHWIESKDLSPALTQALHEFRLKVFSAMMTHKKFTFKVESNGSDPTLSSSRPRNGERRKKRTEAEITESVMQYAQLAVYLGDTVALDILQMVGVLDPGERSAGLSCISRYLGECASTPPDPDDILINVLGMPEEILRNMTVFEKMHRSMVEHCYRILMRENADTIENQPQVLRSMEKRIRELLGSLYKRAFGRDAKTISQSHTDLLESTVLHFKTAAGLKIPDHMAQTALDHNGTEWPLGSLRQRLALTDVMNPDKRHAYIGFDAGGGKTFTHIWAYELTRKERERSGEKGRTRMLFLGPKAVIGEIPNRIREGAGTKETDSRYYRDPETAPTVGVIRAGMSSDEVREAASKDIVFCAYSMWNVKKKEKTRGKKLPPMPGVNVADLLVHQDEPFTNLSLDEAHLLQGDRNYTGHARRTIQEIPDLFSKGHIVASSATPAPGHLAGLRVTLELLEANDAESAHGQRRIAQPNQWARLRRMLGKFWMMDEPEQWMQHVERVQYSLQPDEMECIEWIVNDSTLLPLHKLALSQLAIRSPRLLSGNPSMPWSSFDQTTKELSTLLFDEGRSTVLVAENMLSDKVLRVPKEETEFSNPEDFFFHALQEWCAKQEVKLHIIHGETPEDERIATYAAMKRAKETGEKSVLFAQSKCLNLGIDLRFIQGIISQQWPYNTPDLYQLLKRALRMGNTDCRVIALYAKDTVEQGILTGAELKYADTQRCLHGVAVTDSRLEELAMETESNLRDVNIRSRIESVEQKWKRFSSVLHGVGRSGSQDFWNKHQNDFLEILDRKDSSAAGDADRMVTGLVMTLEKNKLLPENGKYLQTSSMGLGVNRLLEKYGTGRKRSIRSMDPTQEMLDYGWFELPECTETDSKQNIVGTPKDLQHLVTNGTIEAGSQDLVILSGLEQTKHAVHDGELHFTGRVRALRGASMSLRTAKADGDDTGGILIIPLPDDACSAQEIKSLRDQLVAFGFEVFDTYTGTAVSRDNEGEPEKEMHVITARKVFDCDVDDLKKIKPESLSLTQLQGRKAKRTQAKRRLPYELPHQDFRIGKRQLQPIPASGRADKLAYLQRLKFAVQRIRSLAPSSTAMLSIIDTAEIQLQLADLGVVDNRHVTRAKTEQEKRKKKKKKAADADTTDEHASSLERRLAFHFTGSKHFFYPFDKQWDEKSVSEE